MIDIPVGEYLPDLPEHRNPGALTALNVIPDATSYRPWPALSITTAALTARCQGAYVAKSLGGTTYNLAGDATKLYSLASNGTWSDVSRSAGGAYTISSNQFWEFAKWGESVIAVNGADADQTLSLGASNFVALSGSPPVAKHIAVVRDFVVLGNIASFPERVQWSGINDSTTWAASATTMADSQDLVGDGGAVQKVCGGEFGLILQENAIVRMTWAGTPLVFQFDKIETARGCAAPQSVVKHGSMCFYFSADGFYLSTGAGPSTPIGHGKVDRTILSDLDQSYVYRMNAIADPVNKLYIVAYPGNGNVGGLPNKLAIYNWAASRWSLCEVDTEFLFRSIGIGYTLDGLDTLSTNVDLLTIPLDDPFYNGSGMNTSAFNSSHMMGNFSGTAMDATVDTTEIQLFPGLRAHATAVRPMVQTNEASIKVGTRNMDSEAVTFGNTSTQNSSGECPVRSNGRYHRVRINTTGDFDHISGARVMASPEGTR